MVTVGPVYDIADIQEDPHFRERDIVVELPDAESGTIQSTISRHVFERLRAASIGRPGIG
jgi:crotonobetainyl-CoA:carnitine CoA-transferase CaiB-like acyl-CoA transferase